MNVTVFEIMNDVFQIPVSELSQRLPTDSFFWLDIDGASEEELQSVATVLNLSEPTSSWLSRFGQRALLEAGSQQSRISTWGIGASGLPIEVHVLFSQSWILTVHAGCGGTMDRARGICRNVVDAIASHNFLSLIIILTELVTSFDSLLEHLDELLNDLEEQVIQAPNEAQLEQLVSLRKQLWSFHRILEPQQGAAKHLALSLKGLPGKSERSDLVRDYAERISELIDWINDLRQRATDAMGSYGTSISNKQSRVINRLTTISAIFLPMTFLTGYLGMNFQWMNDNMEKSKEAFFILGIGLFVVMLSSTLFLFRNRGWLGEKELKKPMKGGSHE